MSAPDIDLEMFQSDINRQNFTRMAEKTSSLVPELGTIVMFEAVKPDRIVVVNFTESSRLHAVRSWNNLCVRAIGIATSGYNRNAVTNNWHGDLIGFKRRQERSLDFRHTGTFGDSIVAEKTWSTHDNVRMNREKVWLPSLPYNFLVLEGSRTQELIPSSPLKPIKRRLFGRSRS